MCGTPRPLVAFSTCRIDHCSCGNLHLHVGPVTMRVSAEVLAQLADASWLALSALRTLRPQPDAEPDGPPR